MARSRMVIGFQAFRESLGIGIMFGWPIQQSDCGDRFAVVRAPSCGCTWGDPVCDHPRHYVWGLFRAGNPGLLS